MLLHGDQTAITGDNRSVVSESFSVSATKLDVQSVLNCFMALKPLSASAVAAGTVSSRPVRCKPIN